MSNKTRLYIRRFIVVMITAFFIWLIMSMAEISGHNHASLYGESKPYSNWNIVVMFSNALERSNL